MWSFERFGDRTALVDEHGASLTYRQLKREADALCAAAGGRCLTFNLCRNTLGSLLGYAGFVEGGVVPGLYAVGTESVGVMHNDYYWALGQTVGWGHTSGILAAEAICG